MTDKTTETETPNEDVSGLKAKNADLLKKLSAANQATKDLEARLNDLEADRTDALDSTKNEAEREKAKLQREIDKLTKANLGYETRLSGLLIDTAINEAIASNGVMPQFAKAVALMLKADAKVENGEAMVSGVPLADHITGFFSGADAKHFVAAPANSGGGATGSTALASKWSKPPVTANELMEWDLAAVANPTEFNARADGWSRPDLKV